jgi:hypothetical protein
MGRNIWLANYLGKRPTIFDIRLSYHSTRFLRANHTSVELLTVVLFKRRMILKKWTTPSRHTVLIAAAFTFVAVVIWQSTGVWTPSEHSVARKRILIKSGGIPSEGFGSSLQFIKDGIRIAKVLDVDFAPIRSFDFRAEYNPMDELNLWRDLNAYDWNNACNLHTSVTKEGGHETFPDRVTRLRKEVAYLTRQAVLMAEGKGYDRDWIKKAKNNLEKCSTIIYADQDVHQDHKWDNTTREWIREAIHKNARIKLARKKARHVQTRDIHIHYRWGDVVAKLSQSNKWRFDNEKLEYTIRTIELCLQRDLTSNIFMKRSDKMESQAELQAIVHPVRHNAHFIEGEDDIVDLQHLSEAKILAITGGTYSSTAAAIGRPKLVLHNGWNAQDYAYLELTGTVLLQQGFSISQTQCDKITGEI